MVAVGSRFCTAAETRYALVEGEMLALQWALHKTSHYTLGCPGLMALTDHKPLLGLIGRLDVGDIENPRLANLVEKTMRWNFTIDHIA